MSNLEESGHIEEEYYRAVSVSVVDSTIFQFVVGQQANGYNVFVLYYVIRSMVQTQLEGGGMVIVEADVFAP